MNTTSLINDNQTLVSAKSRFGHPIPIYDDGYGHLYISRDSMGINGIVRAQNWEDAYSICEDEFFPAGDEDAGEEMQRIEQMDEGDEKEHAQACFDEAFGYRGNTRRMPDGSLSSIYAKDINGDRLDTLTHALLAQLEITLEIESESEPDEYEGPNYGSIHRLVSLPSGRRLHVHQTPYGTWSSVAKSFHLRRCRQQCAYFPRYNRGPAYQLNEA